MIDDKLNLSQNYPNPANPSTVIEFTIPIEKGKKSNIAKNVRIDIFDSLGKRISTPLNNYKHPGTYSILFNGSSAELDLSSGIYFYKLSYDDQSITKKLMFLK